MIELQGKVKKSTELKGQITQEQALHGNLRRFPIEPETYILVTEDGEEFPAVLVNEAVVFDATENDIRLGTMAATAYGVTEGKKVIPTYHTTEGYRVITEGSTFQTYPLSNLDLYDFTKLQAIICPVNGTVDESVAAEKIAINESVYAVQSTEVIATVIKDSETKTINLGIKNESGSPYLLRYFTYKEIV